VTSDAATDPPPALPARTYLRGGDYPGGTLKARAEVKVGEEQEGERKCSTVASSTRKVGGGDSHTPACTTKSSDRAGRGRRRLDSLRHHLEIRGWNGTPADTGHRKKGILGYVGLAE